MKAEKCYRIKYTDKSGLQYFDVEVWGEKALESHLYYIEHTYGKRARENAEIKEHILSI